jgi:hypothetical protein
MIGVEAVDNILFGSKEFTLHYPSLANERGAKNTSLKYDERSHIFDLGDN